MHMYTAEQLQFLRECAPNRPRAETAVLFNERFGLQLSLQQITSTCKRYGINSGRDTRFKPGNKTWNSGLKGSIPENRTSFKKGNRPHTWRPVGTEVVEKKSGYVKVKIAEPNVWAHKHVLLWKERHGDLPPGHVVIFADGDKTNFTEGNLVVVSRGELAVLNKNRLIYPDQDATKAGITIARLIIKAQHRMREQKR